MSDERDSEELSHEAIERDPWNAVYLRLPETPSPALLSEAHWNAEYCYEAAANRAQNPDWRGQRAFEPQNSEYGPSASDVEHAKSALARLEDLERLDPTLERLSPRNADVGLPGRARDTSSENENSTEVAPVEQRELSDSAIEPEIMPDERSAADSTSLHRSADQGDERSGASPNSEPNRSAEETRNTKSADDPQDKVANVEISDRMRRLLDQPDVGRSENEEQRDKGPGLDAPRDISGGGRTRGR